MLALVAALGMYLHPAVRLLIGWRYGQWRLCGAETGDRMPRPRNDGDWCPVTDTYWCIQYLDLDAILDAELVLCHARQHASLDEDAAMNSAVEETHAYRAEKTQ